MNAINEKLGTETWPYRTNDVDESHPIRVTSPELGDHCTLHP